MEITGQYTVCPVAKGRRNEAVNRGVLVLIGPQRLLWDPKNGRKLLLGTEGTFMG